MDNITRFHVIGVQKGGTTWIRNQLVRSPEIRVPRMKEVNLYLRKQADTTQMEIARISSSIDRLESKPFDENKKRALRVSALIDEKKRYLSVLKGTEDYEHLFGEIPSTIKAYGDVSPSMALLKSSQYEAILKKQPNTKFIVSFRDPVDRLMSAFRMAAKSRGGVDKIDNPGKLLNHLIKGSAHGSVSRYDLLIKELEASVPQENILYMFYENIFSQNANTQAKQLADFLGVSKLNFDTTEVVNKTDKSVQLNQISTDLTKWARKNLASQYDIMFYKFGDELPGKWRVTKADRNAAAV